MSTHKNIDLICIAVIVLGLVLTVLFMNGEALGLQKLVDADSEKYEGSAYFTANDLNGDWDASGATMIALNGDGARISGSGAYFYDGNVVIASAGRYVVSGALEDGGIVVDAYSSSKVWLRFAGVSLRRAGDACLRVEQADKVFLTLAEGTSSTLTSGDTFSDAAVEAGRDGAVFARDDLTINGGGSLTVAGGYKHGIAANDDLVITGGTISIDCPQDAVHVNDSFRFCNADLSIAAGDDGIHCDTEIYIESGTVLISECYEGIEAPQIDIAGGDITIYPSDDGLNANGGSDAMGGGFGFGGGMMGGRGGRDGAEDAAGSVDGTPGAAETPADGNGESGTAETSSEEDGESEMPKFRLYAAEGAATERAAAEGAADSAATGAAEDTDGEELPCIYIRGGTLTIINENAQDADGIDSNGSIYISGGTVRVAMGGSGYALDVGSESGGVMEISGGSLVGCGGYAMAESFDASSAQPSILYAYSAGAPVGTTVALEDADGNVLVSYTSPCAFTCVNLSCPEMAVGGTYLMVIGDNVEEITLEEVSASYGDAQSGGFGGTFNMSGGMRSREDFGGMDGGPGGGRGNRPGFSSGESSGESPDFGGEMPDFSEMPEPPDFDGETPDFSGFDGEMPEMPDFDGEMPDMPGFPGRQDGAAGSEAAAGATAEASAGYSAEVWLRCGVSLAVLLAGLAFAVIFRKY